MFQCSKEFSIRRNRSVAEENSSLNLSFFRSVQYNEDYLIGTNTIGHLRKEIWLYQFFA